MPYSDRLKRWLVVRLLANMQRTTVAAFVKCSDAEGYLKIVQQIIPEGQFEIVFYVKESDRSN